MKLEEKILTQCENAREAALKLANVKAEDKNNALLRIAKALEEHKFEIIKANQLDVEESKGKISSALLKRLKVDSSKIREMTAMLKGVVKLEDPVGKILTGTELDNGLELFKVAVPIGVIGCIFESRPDVVVQISALCIKSGNAVILKGGSEAKNTNEALVNVIRDCLKIKDAVQLISTREEANEMLKMDTFIDLIIPRGSGSFVKYIQENTKIPVLGHSEGICHVYVDKDAELEKAIKIAFDAKCQYPAVCNAAETLLVHKSISAKFIPLIVAEYLAAGVECRLDDTSLNIINKDKSLLLKKIKNKNNFKKIKKASLADWKTEYNDLIISIKVVDSVEEAIKHINKYGSKHTDAIVTENKDTAAEFLDFVDSSSVMWNASTRFADGFRYGFGAEVGISTGKIHARGPVGLEGLMTYKFKLIGKGHVVSDYASGKKRFRWRKVKK